MTEITMQRAMFILGHAYGLNGTRGISAIFEGAPGDGKTTLMNEFAAKYLGNHAVTLETSRLQGTDLHIPIPDHTTKRIGFYASEDIADLAAEKDGLLFLDELNRASDQSTLAACINLFLERRLGRLDFRHITVWGACNPASMVGGIELDAPFINRVVAVQWPADSDPEDYAAHMTAIDPVSGKRAGNEWPDAPRDWEGRWPDAWRDCNVQVCGFLRTSPHLLREEAPSTARPWRSKRSWHTATNVLAACLLHKATIAETRALLGWTIGPEAAHSFLAWRANANLPNPRDVVDDKVDMSRLRSDEMFLALSSAADYAIAEVGKGRGINIETFVDCLDACADLHMEVVAPIAGRLVRNKIAPKYASKLFAKLLPTK